jgi:hypothetical protein
MKRVSLVIGCHLSSATVACGLMTAVGVLSALGTIGHVVAGWSRGPRPASLTGAGDDGARPG